MELKSNPGEKRKGEEVKIENEARHKAAGYLDRFLVYIFFFVFVKYRIRVAARRDGRRRTFR